MAAPEPKLRLPPTYHDKVKKSVSDWVTTSKFVRIFVVGKTGTGKSTLVNALTGREAATVGNTLNPETSEVTRYGFFANGVTVEVWDTPGLEDETEFQDEYLKHIAEQGPNKDLYLFCISMANTRLVESSGEIQTMKVMTDKLGPFFWDNTVIVLTFANKVVKMAKYAVDADDKESIQKYFVSQLDEWKRTIRHYLMEAVKLDKKIAESIAIFPAGNSSVAKLPDSAADGTNAKWISKLFLESLFVTKVTAQPLQL